MAVYTVIVRTALKKSFIFSEFFIPGLFSTPLETSTAQGFTIFTASHTFDAVRPPERIIFPNLLHLCNKK